MNVYLLYRLDSVGYDEYEAKVKLLMKGQSGMILPKLLAQT